MKKLSPRIATAAVGTIAGLIATIAISSPAQAARSACEGGNHLGEMCMWDNTNYSGPLRNYLTTGSFDDRCRDTPTRKSYYNNSVVLFRLYNGAGCTGNFKSAGGGNFSSNFTVKSYKMVGIG
ncbi:peptidase inhibitor family I36 protein [Actinoplanes sp. NPDC049599]|uniref:peptidase inhibitor family I36 protein n=1 Tax=Actinoplanes sp. NPDC049599 TaxID=3363903 RepID=UPI0037B428CD